MHPTSKQELSQTNVLIKDLLIRISYHFITNQLIFYVILPPKTNAPGFCFTEYQLERFPMTALPFLDNPFET